MGELKKIIHFSNIPNLVSSSWVVDRFSIFIEKIGYFGEWNELFFHFYYRMIIWVRLVYDRIINAWPLRSVPLFWPCAIDYSLLNLMGIYTPIALCARTFTFAIGRQATTTFTSVCLYYYCYLSNSKITSYRHKNSRW